MQRRNREPEESFLARRGKGFHQLGAWMIRSIIVENTFTGYTGPFSELTLLGLVAGFALFIGVIRKLSRRAQPEKVHTSLRRIIASRYVALETITSDSNFHRLQMVSKASGQRVFMKCLRATATRAACLRFAREYRALKALRYPNIVKMTDWTRVGASCCLSTEYADFGSLNTLITTTANNIAFIERFVVLGSLGFSNFSHLKSAMTVVANRSTFTDRLSVYRSLGHLNMGDMKTAINVTARNIWFRDRLIVFKQIVSAVQYLHQAGWAHLNIRPENVLVYHSPTLVKLSGFSRARKLRDNGNSSCHYNHCLHKSCSPPEVCENTPSNAFSVDIWSLGALFLFLHTGTCHHFDSDLTTVNVIDTLGSGPSLPPIGQYSKLIMDMLSPYPPQRPDPSAILNIIESLE